MTDIWGAFCQSTGYPVSYSGVALGSLKAGVPGTLVMHHAPRRIGAVGAVHVGIAVGIAVGGTAV